MFFKPKSISSPLKVKMSVVSAPAFVLNRENALLIASLLEKLPVDMMREIDEYNSEHAKAWRNVMDSVVRHVFCPSYFHALDEDVYIERMYHRWNANELKFQFRCGICSKNKMNPQEVLSQLKNMGPVDNWIICVDCEKKIDETWFDNYDENEWYDSNIEEYDIDESAFDP